MSTTEYVNGVLEGVRKRNPGEPEFLQAAERVAAEVGHRVGRGLAGIDLPDSGAGIWATQHARVQQAVTVVGHKQRDIDGGFGDGRGHGPGVLRTRVTLGDAPEMQRVESQAENGGQQQYERDLQMTGDHRAASSRPPAAARAAASALQTDC